MVKWNYGEHADECSDKPRDANEGIDNKAGEFDDCSSNVESSDSSSIDDDDEDLTTDSANAKSLSALNNNDQANFGNIAVKNSTDIHIGNKTFYQGPVTIKQFVYANGKDPVNGLEDDLKQITTQGGIALKNVGQECLSLDDVFLSTKSAASSQESQHHPREKPKYCLGLLVKRHRCTLLVVTFSVAVTVALVTLLLVTNRRTESNPSTDAYYSGESTFNQPNTKYNVTLSDKLRLLSRTDWLAQPATEPVTPLRHPTPLVIVSHTATEQCNSQAQCIYFVRNTQTFHIESKGWSDIGYNFLIGGDGYVYVGRGWDQVGAHAYGYNICSIGISFIGTYLKIHPNNGQFLALKLLIEEGMQLGKLSPDYQLLGHRQVSATESPGQALYDDLMKLPHWSSEPKRCVKKLQ